MPSKSAPRANFNEISGPAATTVIVVAILLIGLAGYFFFVRDNHKIQTQAEVNSEMSDSLDKAQQQFQQQHFGSATPSASQGMSAAEPGAMDRLQRKAPAAR